MINLNLVQPLSFAFDSLLSLQNSKYHVLNRDQWYNVLEFSRTISPDLSNYDEDGASKYFSLSLTDPPRGFQYLFFVIIWVSVVLNRTVIDSDQHLDNLSGGHR